MRDDIRPGATFPDYELPDHTDTMRKLSVLQGDDPMVVVLSRGYYCPKDRQQLMELVPFAAHCVVGFTRLVTITTDTLLQVNELRMGLGANWPFLHDERRTVQKDLDIQEYTDPDHDPMIPHTFVLEPQLRIHKIYNGYWFWGRPTPHELHLELRAISERIRPDWRIDTQEMRTKWDEPEKKAFFPYGRSMKDVMARAANAFDQI